METRTDVALEKLKKENKKLKTTNIILVVYVILSLVIITYNYMA